MNYDIELTIRDRETQNIAVTIVPLGDGLQNLSVSSSIDNIKFDIVDNEVKNEKL